MKKINTFSTTSKILSVMETKMKLMMITTTCWKDLIILQEQTSYRTNLLLVRMSRKPYSRNQLSFRRLQLN